VSWYSISLMVAPLTVLLVAIVLVIYLAFLWPPEVKRRALMRQARQDYEEARGTAHRHLLQDALRRALESQAENRATRRLQANKLDILQLDHSAALKTRLSEYIIQTRLQQVPGVGQKLKQQIIRSVFRGRLSDLNYAKSVPGVG